MLADWIGYLNESVAGSRIPLLGLSMFGFVFLSVLAILHVVQLRQVVKRRAIAFNPAGNLRPATQLTGTDVEDASELLFAVEKGLPSNKASGISKIRRELIRAGYFGRDAVFWYYISRFALAVPLAGVFLFGPGWVGIELSVGAGIIAAVLGASVGLIGPAFYVRHRQNQLLQQCRSGFPNFLDLLVVCSEAGLTPRAGIERVSREITRTHPFLGANLFLVSLELQAGRPLVEAMEGLGRRTQLEEIRSLGSLLAHTEELGTSLTTSLRVFSDELRTRRFMKAEERAHSLPVKLVLPLALFVFPVMLIVVLMPVVIRIQKAFL